MLDRKLLSLLLDRVDRVLFERMRYATTVDGSVAVPNFRKRHSRSLLERSSDSSGYADLNRMQIVIMGQDPNTESGQGLQGHVRSLP